MAKAATARERAKLQAKSILGKFSRSVAETSGVIAHVLGVLLYRWVLYPNRTPNQETIDTLREMDAGIGVTQCKNPEDLGQELDRA